MAGSLLFAGMMPIVMGIYLFTRGLSSVKRKNLIEITPISKIRSIAFGLVEISGRVVPYQSEMLTSPFSGLQCVFYRYTVQALENSGRGGPQWQMKAKGQDGIHFLLRDETGSVLVNPFDAEFDIPGTYSFESGNGVDPPEHVVQFLQTEKIKYKGFLGKNKRMRFEEYIVVPNDSLFVMGNAGHNPLAGADAQDNDSNIIIQKSKSPKVYYISDKGERTILKSLHSKIVSGIIGGSLLIVVGASVITLSYFKFF